MWLLWRPVDAVASGLHTTGRDAEVSVVGLAGSAACQVAVVFPKHVWPAQANNAKRSKCEQRVRKAAVAGVGNNSIRPVQEGVLSLLADKSPVKESCGRWRGLQKHQGARARYRSWSQQQRGNPGAKFASCR